MSRLLLSFQLSTCLEKRVTTATKDKNPFHRGL